MRERGLTLAVAESCTGGMLSSLITSVAGSSDYFLGGVVAYGNDVKKAALGVKAATLRKFGAVSSRAAVEMATGVRSRLRSDIGVSITGIAGPGGGTAKKPVGTVFISVAAKKVVFVRKFLFKGARDSVRQQAAAAAVMALKEIIGC